MQRIENMSEKIGMETPAQHFVNSQRFQREKKHSMKEMNVNTDIKKTSLR